MTPGLERARRLAAFATAAVAAAGCGNGETKTVTLTPVQETVTQPAADPNSALLELGHKCNAALDTGAFAANLRVGNQGDTGLRIWSFARWDQEGGEPVTSVKTFQLLPGRYRTVKYRVKAMPGQIAAHRAAGSRCRVESRVVGTFGSAG